MIPRTASVVVIGAGTVGCSIAYHLARRGVRDVVVIERETVGSGTTSKAAGGIRAQFGTEPEIRFSLEGQKVLETFKEEFGGDPGFQRIGYLFLVSSPETLRGFETRIALQRRLGVDVRVITPKEAQAIVPNPDSTSVRSASCAFTRAFTRFARPMKSATNRVSASK